MSIIIKLAEVIRSPCRSNVRGCPRASKVFVKRLDRFQRDQICRYRGLGLVSERLSTISYKYKSMKFIFKFCDINIFQLVFEPNT